MNKNKAPLLRAVFCFFRDIGMYNRCGAVLYLRHTIEYYLEATIRS